jgi:hypothetical protein
MPNFYIILQKHLVLLHELNRYSQIVRDRGAYFTYSSKFICHYSHDLITLKHFLIFKRIEMLCSIYYRAKDMPILLVIMKLYVNFKGLDVTICIFHEKLLNSLNEYRDP